MLNCVDSDCSGELGLDDENINETEDRLSENKENETE